MRLKLFCFVEKQKQSIIDLTLRNLMLDARVAYMEQGAKQIIEEFEQQKQVAENRQQEISQTLTLKESEIEHLRSKVQELTEQLQKQQTPVAKK